MPVVRKVESVFRRGLVIIITPTSAVVTVTAVGFGPGRSIIQQVMLETVVLRPAERAGESQLEIVTPRQLGVPHHVMPHIVLPFLEKRPGGRAVQPAHPCASGRGKEKSGIEHLVDASHGRRVGVESRITGITVRVRTVVTYVGMHGEQMVLCFPRQPVIGIHPHIIHVLKGRRTGVTVTLRQVSLRSRFPIYIPVAPFGIGREVVLNAFRLILPEKLPTGLPGDKLTVGQAFLRPFAVFARPVIIHVGVVHPAEKGDTRAVGITQAESPSGIAAVRTASRRDIGHIAGVVFAFEAHIHHVGFFLRVVTEELAAVGRLVIHFHLLHREGRQVVEHLTVVALEKVRTVQRQVIHLTAIDVNLAVRLQFRSGQLADQFIEHRPFGQVEGICIVDHRIAPVSHPDFGSLYHHFSQTAVCKRRIRTTAHLMIPGIDVGIACHVTHRAIHVFRIVIGMLGFDDVTRPPGGYIELVIGVLLRCTGIETLHVHGVHHSAVFAHQCDERAVKGGIGKTVLHMPPKGYGAHLGRIFTRPGFLGPGRHSGRHAIQ